MKILERIKEFIEWYHTCTVLSKIHFAEEKYKHMRHVRCPQCKETTIYYVNDLRHKEYLRDGISMDQWAIPISKVFSGNIEPGGISCISSIQISRGGSAGYLVGKRYEYKCHTCGSIWSEERF